MGGVRAATPPRRSVLALVLVLGLLAPLLFARGAEAASRRVPFGFLGVMADGVLLDPKVPLDAEMAQMAQTGVETIRIGIYWSTTQPYAGAAEVPAGAAAQYPLQAGIPTDWAASDQLYAAAAAHGLRVLPVILQAPAWARQNPALQWSPPADPSAYGQFVALVVQRYGPGGSFWAQHPELTPDPSTAWQIWNEPAGGTLPNAASLFWASPTPFQDPYVAMLRAAHTAVKTYDPQGEVILAGLFGRGWLALQSLYQHGARGLFDAVGINIFTRLPQNVVLALRYTRDVMNRAGDRALPLLVSEFSWPSALGHVPEATDRSYGYDTTLAGQASNLTSALRLLMAARASLNLQQVVWYTWLTRDAARDSSFEYAGLRHLDPTTLRITAKPAQAAYRAAAFQLEGCRKTAIATTCG